MNAKRFLRGPMWRGVGTDHRMVVASSRSRRATRLVLSKCRTRGRSSNGGSRACATCAGRRSTWEEIAGTVMRVDIQDTLDGSVLMRGSRVKTSRFRLLVRRLCLLHSLCIASRVFSSNRTGDELMRWSILI